MVRENLKIYSCQNCGAQSAKWQGQCSECGKWGTIKEDSLESSESAESIQIVAGSAPKVTRLKSGIREIDSVFGGGIASGSLALLAGDPGIGKSTLVLQLAHGVAKNSGGKSVYVCGEESPDQVYERILRLGLDSDLFQFLSSSDVKAISGFVSKEKPSLVVVDSIQTVFDSKTEGSIGSVNQIRAATARFLELSKHSNIPIVLIGHVTKEGMAAGPKVMEHMVDSVLYLEGDTTHQYRLLRVSKNRFGPANMVGVFTMEEKGLAEVINPSELFLQKIKSPVPGSSVSVVIEGNRPFVVEIQALTNKTSYGYPKRACTGFDLSRLELILAVLSRRVGLNLENQDVFLNVVGGLKIKDTAVDFAAALAVASSLSNQPMPSQSILLGEIGLGGEIRPVSRIAERVREAEKIGFKEFFIPDFSEANLIKNAQKIINLKEGLEILGIKR
jgi:DNA repair protein RadA/Sms